MAEALDLFSEESTYSQKRYRPLADKMRPHLWEDFAGAHRIDNSLLKRLMLGEGVPPSLVLWGPPGCGKTTLAKLIGKTFDCEFVEFSAVLGGVKEVREVVARAKHTPKTTLLFVDEIHRFNKSQQDAFLPHVESGRLVLIGATTENPSFSLNNALLSRVRVLKLESLTETDLLQIVDRVAKDRSIQIDPEAKNLLCKYVAGDARGLLNIFEAYIQAGLTAREQVISSENIKQFLSNAKTFFYDRKGDSHYDLASAFIKSLRGSNPDAALFWGFKMLESGEDPRFLIRRLIIFASEDISNADPRALQLAVATAEAYDRVGLPEGRIPIAQCITYLATAPKSNRSYLAMHKALAAIQEYPDARVPLHLRNAPTALMKDLGYAKNYVYPHDTEAGFAPGIEYLPEELAEEKFYDPAERGYEIRIRERINFWKGNLNSDE